MGKRILLAMIMLFSLNALLIPMSGLAEGNLQVVRTTVSEYSNNPKIPSGGIDIEGIKTQADSVDGSNLLPKVQDLSIYIYAFVALIALLCLLFGKVRLCVSLILLGGVAVMGIHNVETIIATILSVGQWFFDYIGD